MVIWKSNKPGASNQRVEAHEIFANGIEGLTMAGSADTLFEWLSRSISTTSQSIPGERVALDVNGIGDWAALEP